MYLSCAYLINEFGVVMFEDLPILHAYILSKLTRPEIYSQRTNQAEAASMMGTDSKVFSGS